MRVPRPTTLTAAAVVLALTSVVGNIVLFALPQGDDGVPTTVIYISVTLGILGVAAAYGLWQSQRWGLYLALTVIVLNLISSAPGMFFAPTAALQVVNVVGFVVSVITIVLLMRPSARASFAR